MLQVESSRITEMGYEAETATIFVRFTDGVSWSYCEVPPEVWEEFLAAPSKGSFIHQVLNGYRHGPAGI